MATGTPGPVLDILRKHMPFDRMAPEHLGFLAAHLRLGFYPKGEVIALPEEGPAQRLFIIKQGHVQGRPKSPNGISPDAAWEKGPGEVFPMGALQNGRSVVTAHVAVEDTFCFELDLENFERLLEMSPVFRGFMTGGAQVMEQLLRREVQSVSISRVSEDLPLTAPVGSFVRREPVTCLVDAPVYESFQSMSAQHVGSIVAVDGDGHPRGILTLRDVLPRVVLPRRPLDTPFGQVMTPKPISLPPSATAADAALLMARHGVAHLCVVEDGRLVGVVSERDLFALQRVGMVHLTRAILNAPDVPALARAAANVHVLVDQMMAQGVAAGPMVHIITTLNDHTVQRAIALSIAQAGGGLPAFTWLAFGSEGRNEQTLKTDQDNGMVFDAAPGAAAEEARAALLPLAARINQVLAECGFPLCPGNIMAGNPQCCLSREEWQQRFADWIDQGTPAHLLSASIFFDFRPLFGAAAPAEALWEWIADKTTRNSRFLHQMTENALRNRPPLGLLRDFALAIGGAHPHTLNLKMQGTTPFVDGARVFALRHGIRETNTGDRLWAAVTAGALPADEVDAWCDSFAFILLLRMRHHRLLSHQGRALDNHLDPNDLNELDRRILKESFRQARKLQARLALDYAL